MAQREKTLKPLGVQSSHRRIRLELALACPRFQSKQGAAYGKKQQSKQISAELGIRAVQVIFEQEYPTGVESQVNRSCRRWGPENAYDFFLLQSIDQLNRREEADALTVMLNRLDAKSGGDMRFPSSRASDQHHVFGPIHELTAVQLADQGFTDFTGGKIESRKILVCREAGGFHMIGD